MFLLLTTYHISEILWSTYTPQMRCVPVPDTLARHWHIWLHWTMPFFQTIIGVSVCAVSLLHSWNQKIEQKLESGKKMKTLRSSSILATWAWMPSTISFKGDIVGYLASSQTNLDPIQITKFQPKQKQSID
jgi:hypothetical protein